MILEFRRYLASSKDERGMSMSELIVSMAVFAILLTVVAGLFVGLSRATALSRALDGSTRVASNALNELALVVRNGTTVPQSGNTTPRSAFSFAGTEELTIYSIVGEAAVLSPVKVNFTVNAQRQLIETRSLPKEVGGYWVWPGVSAPTKRNLSGALVVSEVALFTYLNASGVAITPPAGGSLTDEQLALVTAVRITIRVEADAGAPGRIIELKNTVGVPNLGK